MQLSARILTALAVLAFAVGVVAGAQNATNEVSAATGTIDALNVGACTSNNPDAFSLSNCTQKTAFYEQGELGDIIEIPSVYATYAHDPKTAAENPRAILEDSDLVRVSVTDKGRDRRDPVLITSSNTGFDGGGGTSGDPFSAAPNLTATPPVPQTLLAVTDDPATAEPTDNTTDDTVKPQAIVAESAFGDEKKTTDLPDLEQVAQFGTGDVADTTFTNSGTYQVLFEIPATPPVPTVFKPIADPKTQGGKVKFFGRVNDGVDCARDLTADPPVPCADSDGVSGDVGEFQDVGKWVKIDEDVISGETDVAPAMKLNVSVPTGGNVELQLIYYETSGIEYIQGGVRCTETPEKETDVTKFAQAECTADELKPAGTDDDADANNESFVLYAESDEDAGGDGTGATHRKNLALIETGRFTGVFQGYIRLTDADGDGVTPRDNWGLMKKSGNIVNAATTDGDSPLAGTGGLTPAELLAGQAVLGVGNGPVTVMYKDSDGNNKALNVEIDVEPPTIQVDSPAHNERSDDEKPSFIGTFNDNDSGLAAESFQLNVDNRDDSGTPLLVMSIDSDVDGTGADGKGQVLRRLDYTGYSATDTTFGIIDMATWKAELYKTGADVLTTNAEAPFRTVDADDFDDGEADGEFNEEVEIKIDEQIANRDDSDFVFNHAIDFQATVRDLAGNIAFSDSDAAKPRFIDALGEEKQADRDKGPKTHNILGFFSAHVVHIDDKDPEIIKGSSVTGFYGLNSDDEPIRDRSAVMVTFDGGVNGDLIDTGTFTLEHDDGSAIAIVNRRVDGKLVFLKLGEELASDATPTLSITEGREVEDMAGNILSWQEKTAEAFKVKDGILPVFTLTLSGGSGIGVGSESPSKLTEAAMDISISSDEDINGAPRVAVVCSNIGWTTGTGDDKKTFNIDDYVDNRDGYAEDISNESDTSGADLPRCGDSANPISFNNVSSLSRPGNNWVYAWRNITAPASHLNDGELEVVVWGRDRSTYAPHNKDTCTTEPECQNWGSARAKFVLDDTFDSPLKADGSGGSVQPEVESKVKEPRPFVLLDFAGEATTVKVTEFKLDGEDVVADLSPIGDNRFLYWPDDLAFGTHTVEFDARDAANNEPDGKTKFEFDVTARDPFVIDLSAGWNAISLPANPVDTALEAVFTDEAVDRVAGWNPLSATGPWSLATRTDGQWETGSQTGMPLTEIVVRYGYWVHSKAFVKQSVDLQGPINRETGSNPDPIGIITVPGWNFVGVVDQDGDQTENHFGKSLEDSEDVVVTAKNYMPGFRQAYTWDAIANGYRVLGEDDAMEIGKGIWVFFPDDTAIAP